MENRRIVRVLRVLTVAGWPLLSFAEGNDVGGGGAPAPVDAGAHVRKPLPSAGEIAKLPPDGGAEFNRLLFEKSPYLLQHARNPVDWYPWGAEAFEKAKRESKAVFLSVGYSTCHWRHVMERESFEEPAIAAAMNEHFVCVKVDREERPDVDRIYMSVVQMLTGGGGWPGRLRCTCVETLHASCR